MASPPATAGKAFSLAGNFCAATYIYNENDTNRPFEQQVSASQFNIVRDTANKLNLINLGWLFLSSSPHSNYTCTANCGDERK